MFSAIGQHAIAELLGEMAIPIEYETVSKKTGSFNSLSFKTRDDYVQPDIPADAILWDDDSPILWDDDDFIEWDE